MVGEPEHTPALMGTLGEIVPDLSPSPEDTLGEVAERMSAKNVGAVVVKDSGRLIGVLTEATCSARWRPACIRATPACGSG